MKTKIVTLYHSLRGTACAGTVLLIACNALGQNVFVSTFGSGSINEVAPNGTITPFVSGLDYPDGLAFNSAGDLFVANSAENSGETGNITEITPDGTQSPFATGVDPTALAFNSEGDLFQADYRSGNIYEYTPNGKQSTFASGFSFPISLTFDSAGDLFVGSGYGNGNGIITKVTPDGTPSPFASGLYFPSGLVFNAAGDLFESDNGSGNIYEFTPDGVQSPFVSSLNDPGELAIDSAGDLFVPTTASGPSTITVTEITPGGAKNSFGSMPGNASGLALPVPEPSTLGLIGLGAVAFVFRRKKN